MRRRTPALWADREVSRLERVSALGALEVCLSGTVKTGFFHPKNNFQKNKPARWFTVSCAVWR